MEPRTLSRVPRPRPPEVRPAAAGEARPKGAVLALTLVFALTAAAQPEPQREGNTWVRRVQGAQAVQGATRLKVSAAGRIRLENSSRPELSYSWVVRGQATALLNAAQVRVSTSGPWVVVDAPLPPGLSGELVVSVPATLATVNVQGAGGPVTVRQLRAAVTAETWAGPIDMDEITGSVVARTGGGTLSFGTVAGPLRCYSGGGAIRVDKVMGEAVLETAGGEIFVDEAADTLRLSTAGNIRVRQAGRNVVASSAAGLIEVLRAGGMVTARSASGGIEVGPARGVNCEAATGAIRLRGVSGSVRASTASGAVYAELAPGRPLENSSLVSGRGDITVLMPSNLAVTVKALNETPGRIGRILSEFPEIRPFSPGAGFVDPVLAGGSLNGGGPGLLVSASDGVIFIRRLR